MSDTPNTALNTRPTGYSERAEPSGMPAAYQIRLTTGGPPSIHAGKDAVLNRIAVYLLLGVLTWTVFGQTVGHQFVQYDDQTYVYENPEIISGLTAHGVIAAFTQLHARNWHPLTTLSHMLDCQLFGLNPAGHHLINVFLHAATVLLLFSALSTMTGAVWRSAFVAAVFAIHPLRAESVAWIAERKDVLSGLFFMLTLGAYVRYVRHTSLKSYLLVTLFFALGLMSKPMLVTLPVLLLLLDYWPLSRFQNQVAISPNDNASVGKNQRFPAASLILEKIPLLSLALASAAITLVAQRQTVEYSQPLPLLWRISNALISYIAYIGQMLWPAKLAVFYPHSADHFPAWEISLAFLLVAGITALTLVLGKTRPYLGVGWFWYLICLLPVIGLIQVGMQGRADRYTYLPQIGLYIAITWLIADLAIFDKRRTILPAIAALVVAPLAWRGWIQTSYWSTTESLWDHALVVTKDNDVAHNNVAALLMRRGQLDEAIAHYTAALNIRSENNEAPYHLSGALLHNNLGNALARKGSVDEAIVHYRKAVELRAGFADAHSNLAAMLTQKGQIDEAILHYRKALAIPPEDGVSHLPLAALLMQTGRTDEAMAHYQRALELAPHSPVTLNALAWVLATSPNGAIRNGARALTLAEEANQLSRAKNPAVLRTLAAAYSDSARFSEAAAAAHQALALTNDPALARAIEQEIRQYENRAAETASHSESDK